MCVLSGGVCLFVPLSSAGDGIPGFVHVKLHPQPYGDSSRLLRKVWLSLASVT